MIAGPPIRPAVSSQELYRQGTLFQLILANTFLAADNTFPHLPGSEKLSCLVYFSSDKEKREISMIPIQIWRTG